MLLLNSHHVKGLDRCVTPQCLLKDALLEAFVTLQTGVQVMVVLVGVLIFPEKASRTESF